jgi:hypothetical protein
MAPSALEKRFCKEASRLLCSRRKKWSGQIDDTVIVRNFGATAKVCEAIWKLLTIQRNALEEWIKPVHLLWTLYLTKQYPTTEQFERITGKHRITLNKHIQPIQNALKEAIPDIVSSKNILYFWFVYLYLKHLLLLCFRLSGKTDWLVTMEGAPVLQLLMEQTVPSTSHQRARTAIRHYHLIQNGLATSLVGLGFDMSLELPSRLETLST